MQTIHKFPLQIEDSQIVHLPIGARLLSVAIQPQQLREGARREQLCLWALVDAEEVTTYPQDIVLRGTGHPMPSDGLLHFLGSVLMADGQLVWHVFASLSLHRVHGDAIPLGV